MDQFWQGCRQFHQHFMSSFFYKSVLRSFYVLTVSVCNFLVKGNLHKNWSWIVGEIDSRTFISWEITHFMEQQYSEAAGVPNFTILMLERNGKRLGQSGWKIHLPGLIERRMVQTKYSLTGVFTLFLNYIMHIYF